MSDSVIFYRSFFEAITDLTVEQQLNCYNAIFNYAFNGNEPEQSGIVSAIFKMAKAQIDANITRYENGNKGGRPKNSKTSGFEKNENSKPVVSQNQKTENQWFPKNEKPETSGYEVLENSKPNKNDNKNKECKSECESEFKSESASASEYAGSADDAATDAAAHAMSELYGEFEHAGFVMSGAVCESISLLVLNHGREKVKEALTECVTHNVLTLAYLKAVCEGRGKKPSARAPSVPEQVYEQRDYSTGSESLDDMMRRLNGGVLPNAEGGRL